MAPPFVDTNIFVRHLTGDHPDQSPRATAYLKRVETGELRVYTNDTVVFETVFTLEKHYKEPKVRIRDALLPLLELPAIVLPGKRSLRKVFDLYVNLNIPFADAYHAIHMEHNKLSEIVSFDRHFDHIPGITRVEP
ncbi:MAG: type II toxin-antitoxin system VapC family toxin [Herpetosiphonaceae bacterium]|nr:type II toxin-antitoxin system VapC family toxin [Herpetosiphonaceae bacterium]